MERTGGGDDGSTQRPRRIQIHITQRFLNASQWPNVGIWREQKKVDDGSTRRAARIQNTELTQRFLNALQSPNVGIWREQKQVTTEARGGPLKNANAGFTAMGARGAKKF